jgi:hypothetical protein
MSIVVTTYFCRYDPVFLLKNAVGLKNSLTFGRRTFYCNEMLGSMPGGNQYIWATTDFSLASMD